MNKLLRHFGALVAVCALLFCARLPVRAYADVQESSWYAIYVSECTQMGLMQGMLNDRFYPDNSLTVAEGIAVAVRCYEALHPLLPALEAPPPEEMGSGADGSLPQDETEDDAETLPEEAEEEESPEEEDPEETEPEEMEPEEEQEETDATASEDPWYAETLEKAQAYGLWSPEDFAGEMNTAIHRDEMAYLFANALGDNFPQLNQVTSLPDVEPGDEYSQQIYTLYQAGILNGTDKYGTFLPDNTVSRGEAAALLTRMAEPETRLTFTLEEEPELLETIVFGQSGEGRDMIAYRIGTGENVMILNFAIHGFEDHWAADGAELVYLGQKVRASLENEAERVDRLGWTVYVIPCANPDGVAAGWTNNGPGRCTTTMLDTAGNLIYGMGIDLNRCFETGYRRHTSNRNYNGTAPLQALEALRLKEFVIQHEGSGKNIHIDTHGWTQQILTSNPSGVLSQTFHRYFPRNSLNYLGGDGYFTAYTRSLGYDSCLFEFPRDVSSYLDFYTSGYIDKYIGVIWDLLEHY